jgi:hypothetical protein
MHATGPRDRDIALGQRGSQSRGCEGAVAPSGRPFFSSLFFGRAKKRDPGAQGAEHPASSYSLPAKRATTVNC